MLLSPKEEHYIYSACLRIEKHGALRRSGWAASGMQPTSIGDTEGVVMDCSVT
jgi:hypothetical protein